MSRVIVFQHAEDVSLGSLEPIMVEAGIELEICKAYASLPNESDFATASGMIVLGGAMSANDTAQYNFLQVEIDWMRRAMATEVPLLGICLGAQMLAKAAGGSVFRHSHAEVGWYDVHILAAAAPDQLFHDCETIETVFHWHGDTFDLPHNAVLLAEGVGCRNQAFRIGKNAYGIQFHAEMTPEILHQWLAAKQDETADRFCVPADPQSIAAAAEERFPALKRFSDKILSRFAALCRAWR